MTDEQKVYQLGNYTVSKAELNRTLSQYTGLIIEREARAKKILLESNQILKEIPILISWVEKKIPPPPREFEERLRRLKGGA